MPVTIDILLPSRERPELCKQAVDSLLTTAADLSRLKVRLALARDDPTRPRYRAVGLTQDRIFDSYGHAGLHRYYNELAERSLADWMLLWNDDAIMMTKGWDRQIEEAADPSEPWVLSPGGLFPTVSRRYHAVVGHLSHSPHADTWLCDVASAAGRDKRLDLVIVHHKPEDSLQRRSDESRLLTSPAYYSKRLLTLRGKDTAALLSSL